MAQSSLIRQGISLQLYLSKHQNHPTQCTVLTHLISLSHLNHPNLNSFDEHNYQISLSLQVLDRFQALKASKLFSFSGVQ